MTRDKVIHVIMMVIPSGIAIALFLSPTGAPHWLSAIATLLVVASLIANRLALPPWALDALALAQAELAGSPGAPVTNAAVPPSMRVRITERVKSMPTLPVLVLFGVIAALAPTATTSCNATPAQIATTISDGIKLGVCIIGQVLAGITDPTQLLVCEGATADLIVAAIDDFTAPRPTEGGALMSAAQSRGVTPQGFAYLAEARAKAIAKKDGGS